MEFYCGLTRMLRPRRGRGVALPFAQQQSLQRRLVLRGYLDRVSLTTLTHAHAHARTHASTWVAQYAQPAHAES